VSGRVRCRLAGVVIDLIARWFAFGPGSPPMPGAPGRRPVPVAMLPPMHLFVHDPGTAHCADHERFDEWCTPCIEALERSLSGRTRGDGAS
jgi:hypothetical protein